MGYCMTQADSSFHIKREKQDAALKAIKALAENPPKWGYSWVDEKYVRANDLQTALDDWRWETELDDETGDIVGINFGGEKLGDDSVLWKAIAPFVEKDSFIQMAGEDGAVWRWVFNGSSVEEVEPKW